MLRHIAERIKIASDPVDLNAHTQSFLIDARIIVKFFYGPRGERGLLGEDFFADPQRWIAARRTANPGSLDAARVGREIGHVAQARTGKQPSKKACNVHGISLSWTARKSPVQTGSVHLGKDVVEEERTLDVPVTREEVYVERHPVDRRPAHQ